MLSPNGDVPTTPCTTRTPYFALFSKHGHLIAVHFHEARANLSAFLLGGSATPVDGATVQAYRVRQMQNPSAFRNPDPPVTLYAGEHTQVLSLSRLVAYLATHATPVALLVVHT